MKPSEIFIITGQQGEGKTTKLTEVIRLLQDKGQAVFGFYAFGAWENGLRSHFHIRDVKTEQSYLLCERQENSKNQFVFFQEVIQKGEDILSKGMTQPGALAIIDEIGPFELKEQVWYNALIRLLKNDFPTLITVREKLLPSIMDKFGMDHPVIFRLEESSPSIAGKITNQLAGMDHPGHKKSGQ